MSDMSHVFTCTYDMHVHVAAHLMSSGIGTTERGAEAASSQLRDGGTSGYEGREGGREGRGEGGGRGGAEGGGQLTWSKYCSRD